jgi:hypothetical protein
MCMYVYDIKCVDFNKYRIEIQYMVIIFNDIMKTKCSIYNVYIMYILNISYINIDEYSYFRI